MPYANIGEENSKSGRAPGIRIEWAKNDHVRIVTAPFYDKYPEGTYLDSNEANWFTFSLEDINDLLEKLNQARKDVFFRVLDELPLESLVVSSAAPGVWRKVNNDSFAWKHIEKGWIWPWSRLNTFGSVEVIYIPS